MRITIGLVLFYITFFFFVTIPSLFSQSCLPDGITFLNQQEIDNFQLNYPGCSIIEGDVMIHGYNIDNLNGLGILTGIGGMLLIDSTQLTDLQGLNSLVSIGGSFQITRNNYLDHLNGLSSLTEINGELNVSFSGVENFSGMPQIASIGGLRIYFTGTQSLTGLEGLTSIHGGISIRNSFYLQSLASLENVQSINGSVVIQFTWLKSLHGLENIDPHSISDIYISGNDSLSECDVKSICNFLAEPGGNVTIGTNAPGCNNQEEIIEACVLKINEDPEMNNRMPIFPNPTSGFLTVNYTYTGDILVEIFNYQGCCIRKCMLNANSPHIDISDINSGIYFVKIQTKENHVCKIIKE
jgi:hypothetical protein